MKLSAEVKTGIIVTAAICLLIFGFNFLKGRNIFHSQSNYFAVYDRIDGLVEANPVQINGYTVGQVKNIQMMPDNSGRILVEFVVKEDDVKIPKHTIARVISSDLLGSKAIQLLLSNSVEYTQPGDTLISGIQMSLTDEVNKQVLPLKNKVETLMASIDSVLDVVQYIFNEKSSNDIKQSFESLSQSIIILKRTALRVDTLVGEQRGRLNKITEHVESITGNLRNNNEKLSKIITNFSAISDSMAKANVAQTINNANKSLQHTADIMDKISRGEGSMGMLVNNDSLYKNLAAASKDLDLLLEDMRLRPKRYVHFSIFGRKEKK